MQESKMDRFLMSHPRHTKNMQLIPDHKEWSELMRAVDETHKLDIKTATTIATTIAAWRSSSFSDLAWEDPTDFGGSYIVTEKEADKANRMDLNRVFRLTDQEQELEFVLTHPHFESSVACGPFRASLLNSHEIVWYWTNAIQGMAPGWSILGYDSQQSLPVNCWQVSISIGPMHQPQTVTACGPCGQVTHDAFDCPLRVCEDCRTKNQHWTKQCPKICDHCHTRGKHCTRLCPMTH
jgi:hypothetical protein